MKEYIIKKITTTPNWNIIPTLNLDNVLWDSDSCVKASAQLCTDGEYLYVHMCATEKEVIAKHTEIMSPVYEDSCLELFFKAESEENYFNFEINPNGAMILQYGPGVSERISIIREDWKKYFDIRTNRTKDGWELYYRIPQTFISMFYNNYQFDNTLMVNMYKCGGATKNFLSWNKVNSDKPNFHRPKDFGKMIFEA